MAWRGFVEIDGPLSGREGAVRARCGRMGRHTGYSTQPTPPPDARTEGLVSEDGVNNPCVGMYARVFSKGPALCVAPLVPSSWD